MPRGTHINLLAGLWSMVLRVSRILHFGHPKSQREFNMQSASLIPTPRSKLKPRHPWRWAIGSVIAVMLFAAAFFYYTFTQSLRCEYETIRVVQMIEDFVRTHEGEWPLSWQDLDSTETARRLAPLDSSHWRKYTTVDFTIRSEQLLDNPDLIYRAVMPSSGEYSVYPHAKQDLDKVMQAIREAKGNPPRSLRSGTG